MGEAPKGDEEALTFEEETLKGGGEELKVTKGIKGRRRCVKGWPTGVKG